MKSKKSSIAGILLFSCMVLSVAEVCAFLSLKAVYSECTTSFYYKYRNVLEVVNELALAYIMSYIFYIIVLIPEKRRQKSINKYVSIYLGRLNNCLGSMTSVLSDLQEKKVDSILLSPQTVSRLGENGQVRFLTYKEHIVQLYYKFIEEYRNLSYYIAFVDDDLRECLYEIATDSALEQINNMLVIPSNDNYNDTFLRHLDDDSLAKKYEKLKKYCTNVKL